MGDIGKLVIFSLSLEEWGRGIYRIRSPNAAPDLPRCPLQLPPGFPCTRRSQFGHGGGGVRVRARVRARNRFRGVGSAITTLDKKVWLRLSVSVSVSVIAFAFGVQLVTKAVRGVVRVVNIVG